MDDWIVGRMDVGTECATLNFMKEIKSQDWNTFCQRLTEFERGATVDIRWIDRATKSERSIARGAEFEEIAFGQRDGCNDQITVRAGGETETRHEIVEPFRIVLRESTKDGNFNGVAVEAEEGTTVMTFNPAIHAGWLDGVRMEGR